MSAVAVEGVWKFYGDFPALRAIDLAAQPGACLALIGRTAFALYPHQTLFALPADRITLLPADLPASRAVLAANRQEIRHRRPRQETLLADDTRLDAKQSDFENARNELAVFDVRDPAA